GSRLDLGMDLFHPDSGPRVAIVVFNVFPGIVIYFKAGLSVLSGHFRSSRQIRSRFFKVVVRVSKHPGGMSHFRSKIAYLLRLLGSSYRADWSECNSFVSREWLMRRW